MFDFKRINLGITLYILILSVLMYVLPNGKGEVGDKIWHLFLYLIQGGDWTFPIIYPLWILCLIQLVFLFKRNDKKIDYFFLIILNFFFLNILNYLIILAGFLFFIMASHFDGRNEYNIPKKVQAALHVLSS